MVTTWQKITLPNDTCDRLRLPGAGALCIQTSAATLQVAVTVRLSGLQLESTATIPDHCIRKSPLTGTLLFYIKM